MSAGEVNEMAELVGCQTGALPLDYLGMKVGAGLNRLCNWEGIIEKAKRRLLGWDCRKLSMGGRVSLINSVLSAIPIYRMSFAPMPMGTAESLRKIQSNFLWGMGEGGLKKISWVKWADICKSKAEGGLGVKNWRWFNLALLGKWVWRFVSEGANLWVRVITSRHGRGPNEGLHNSEGRGGESVSGWWSKVRSMISGPFGEWFLNKLKRVMGDGLGTSFWEDRWCGEQSLKTKFPRLYHLSVNKRGAVGEMGEWREGGWHWVLNWRRPLLSREWERVEQLEKSLEDCKLQAGCPDKWRWGDKPNGVYTVKEAYEFLSNAMIEPNENDRERQCCHKVWNSVAPFKQQVVGWRILRDRIPTRENLAKKMEISTEGRLCPCCAMENESTSHLLFQCKEVDLLWRKIADWIGVGWAAPYNVSAHFVSFTNLLRGKRMIKILRGLWICVVWVIWRWRNKVIFENWMWEFKKMEEEIRCRFWSWCAVKGICEANGNFTDWSRRKLYTL